MNTVARERESRNGVPLRLLGARIRRARKLAELTIQQLADQVGCSRIHLMRLEKGEHEPSDQLLRSIARETNQKIGFFNARPSGRAKQAVGFDIPVEAQAAVVEAAATFLGALMLAVAEVKRQTGEE